VQPEPTPTDRRQAFASDLAAGIDAVTGRAANLTVPLDQLAAVIDRDVDVAGLRYNMSRVSYFLDDSPSPDQFKAALTDLDSALRGDLKTALQQLAALLDGPGSPLTSLTGDLGAVAALTGGRLAQMDNALSVYAAAAGAALNQG
jgi:hypothetical protein